MKKSLLLIAFIALTASSFAQFQQGRSKNEFMTKLEIGYLPFMTNIGDANEVKYPLDSLEHAAGFNFMMGANISQDFFLGGGVGYAYCAPLKALGRGRHSALAFVDFDYRPLKEKYAPMIGLKLGGSFLTENKSHKSNISPYLEVYAGLNIYTNHVLRDMERNNKAFFVEIGAAYMHRTVFLPIRFGWRW